MAAMFIEMTSGDYIAASRIGRIHRGPDGKFELFDHAEKLLGRTPDDPSRLVVQLVPADGWRTLELASESDEVAATAVIAWGLTATGQIEPILADTSVGPGIADNPQGDFVLEENSSGKVYIPAVCVFTSRAEWLSHAKAERDTGGTDDDTF
jgi:hypothetical protein